MMPGFDVPMVAVGRCGGGCASRFLCPLAPPPLAVQARSVPAVGGRCCHCCRSPWCRLNN